MSLADNDDDSQGGTGPRYREGLKGEEATP